MKVTVCELSDNPSELASEWRDLAAHVSAVHSDLVVLPEMPFYPWWMSDANVDADVWNAAVASHQEWMKRLPELGAACVLGTAPTTRAGDRINEGFIWEGARCVPAHQKHFLPNADGFWEAAWCSRGRGTFAVTKAGAATVGFLICTELWSFETAREYGKAGAHLVASPRASLLATREKWLVAGRAAAVVGGVFSVSSNRRGMSRDGLRFGGEGWVIDPDGKVLGVTSQKEPFLTVNLELGDAVRAKATYPRNVFM